MCLCIDTFTLFWSTDASRGYRCEYRCDRDHDDDDDEEEEEDDDEEESDDDTSLQIQRFVPQSCRKYVVLHFLNSRTDDSCNASRHEQTHTKTTQVFILYMLAQLPTSLMFGIFLQPVLPPQERQRQRAPESSGQFRAAKGDPWQVLPN